MRLRNGLTYRLPYYFYFLGFAKLFDLPKYEAHTLNQVKSLTVRLDNDLDVSLTVTTVSKLSGSSRVKFADAMGNHIDIDSKEVAALAQISGKVYRIKGVAGTECAGASTGKCGCTGSVSFEQSGLPRGEGIS